MINTAFNLKSTTDMNMSVGGQELLDGGYDPAKVTAKFNKAVEKFNTVVAEGGQACADHLPTSNFPAPEFDNLSVAFLVASVLNTSCR